MFKIFKTNTFNSHVNFISNHIPVAQAIIKGSGNYPDINGKVEFFQTKDGTLVLTEINNLPENQTGNFFAMHIHNANNCEQDENKNFIDSPHFNPTNTLHPNHAGDLPVLLSNNGKAFSLILTNRFNVKEIIGKTVFIHENADDYRTDPSGNSGLKIACGVIEQIWL